jgi:hypothetical protein
MGGGMSVRELQRLRERVVQVLADDPRNLVDPARGEVAVFEDPEALREHVKVDQGVALGAVEELRRLGRFREMDHRVGRGWVWGAYRSPAARVLVAVLEGR